MIHVKNLSYSYPFSDTKALEDINLEIKKGEAVLITGPSGCGKSTLSRVLNGLIPHYYLGNLEGSVRVNNIDNSERRVCEIAKDAGSLFQDPEQQFFTLKVRSELSLINEIRGDEPDDIKIKVEAVSEKYKLDKVLDSSIFNLSEGEKQKTALASLSLSGNCIVVLDEPTANLDYQSTEMLASHLSDLKKEGKTIIVVDHRLYWLSSLIDTVYIMDRGRIAEKGNFGILESDQVVGKYGLRQLSVKKGFGFLEDVGSPENNGEASGKCLAVENLNFKYKKGKSVFNCYSVRIPSGSVCAVVGKNGAGKTTFAKLLTGLLKMKDGEIILNGKAEKGKELLKKSGVVFQNTDHQLYMKTVFEELTAGRKKTTEEKNKAEMILDELGLIDFKERHPQSLSGGQKQRLVIACSLMKDPDILILDEPTSGLDGKNLSIIKKILKKEAMKGRIILIITHDYELMQDTCDYKIEIGDREETT